MSAAWPASRDLVKVGEVGVEEVGLGNRPLSVAVNWGRDLALAGVGWTLLMVMLGLAFSKAATSLDPTPCAERVAGGRRFAVHA